jgi:pimeloyl-ACP methyl ester carboxylesterase
MGDSDKLPSSGAGSYRFVEHRRYLDALLEALNVRERVTLVIHDWGSTLGFDWANRHRGAVKGIIYMDAMVGRQYWDHWDKFGMRPVLQALRSQAGEQMVLQDNVFVEKVRKLSDEEMAENRRPFAEPGESRRPTLTWPREIPIEGDPADVTAIVDAYANWLKTSSVPKLFLKAEPGGILAGERHRRNRIASRGASDGVHQIPDSRGRRLQGVLSRSWEGGCAKAAPAPRFSERGSYVPRPDPTACRQISHGRAGLAWIWPIRHAADDTRSANSSNCSPMRFSAPPRAQ